MAERTRLDASLSTVLNEIAYGAEPTVVLPAASLGLPGFRDSGARLSPTRAGRLLTLAIADVDEARTFAERAACGAMPSSLQLPTVDGRTYELDEVHAFFDKTGSGIQSWKWTLEGQNDARYCIGDIEGLPGPLLHCNLIISDGHWSPLLHLRVVGRYTYYVVWRQDDHRSWLVVDLGEESVPDLDAVERDFDVMQLLMGARLRVTTLWTVASSPTVLGCYLGSDPNQFTPSESASGHSEICWAAPFFNSLAQRASSIPSLFPLLVEYYLSSFGGSVDEAYLKLTVAMEGLAQHVVPDAARHRATAVTFGKRGGPLVVEDPDRWADFIDAEKKRPEYEQCRAYFDDFLTRARTHFLVVRDDAGAEVVDWAARLRQPFQLESIARLGAGNRVRAAFAALGLRLAPEMDHEAQHWHGARHTAIASRKKRHPDDGVSVLRTMLVALLVGWAGYRGPIIGWTRHPSLGWHYETPFLGSDAGSIDLASRTYEARVKVA